MASTVGPAAVAQDHGLWPLRWVRRILRRSLRRWSSHPSPIIVVLEGKHDAEFLRRISAVLHAADAKVPDLRAMERDGRIVFLPCGGVDLENWPWRLAPLACREFHLLDRDGPEEAHARREAAALVNLRPGCRAAVTRKRAVENYLHPRAVFEVRGIEIQFSDEDDVADVVASACYAQQGPAMSWELLPLRARKRYRNHVKRWLNTRAVDRMTANRLAERDPDGEVRGWLATIAELARA